MENNTDLYLAGDVGGTNTRLAIFRHDQGQFKCLQHASFANADYDSLEQIIDQFRSVTFEQVESACIGVAGVVSNGRCDATNLPWMLDETELASHCNVAIVRLINDLEAAAHGILALAPSDCIDLNPHADKNPVGNCAVIAAGTGLGEAVIYWDGKQYHPFATEGGHSDFATADHQQHELLCWLRKRLGDHVSYERIVSGPGLVDIYHWLIESGQYSEQTAIKSAIAKDDPASIISNAGLTKKDAACEQALQLFVKIYAQEAGNLALKSLSTGGIYLAGGIAPKILPALQSNVFIQSLLNKGRFSDLLKAMPVKVVTHPQVSLIGAARFLMI